MNMGKIKYRSTTGKTHNRFVQDKYRGAKTKSRVQNYYDRDLRKKYTVSCETDHINTREVIKYGDNCFIEVDSVGEVDETVGFIPKLEPTCESREGNLLETDWNLPIKPKTDRSVDTLITEDGSKQWKQFVSCSNSQGKNSDVTRQSDSFKPHELPETVPYFNESAKLPRENQKDGKNVPKRKRGTKHDRQTQDYKIQKVGDTAEHRENIRSRSCNRLERKRPRRDLVTTWPSTSVSDTETFACSSYSHSRNLYNERIPEQDGNRDPLNKKQVSLEDRREVTKVVARELIQYRHGNQNPKHRCFEIAEGQNFKTWQDTATRETKPQVDDVEVVDICIPTKTDSRRIRYKQNMQQESQIYRGNLKNFPKEVLIQLVKEVYRAIVLSEQRNISTTCAIEIMRTNESIQIDFENEEELQYLLTNYGENFILKKMLGETLISPRTDIKICQTFTNNQSVGHECMDLHICKYFLLGNCSLRPCKFSHRLSSKHNMKVLRTYGLDGLPDRAVKALVSNIDNRNVSTTPLICKFYNNEGGCQKGTSCMHLHVCMHYINGNCKFKSMCKRSHDICEKQPTTVLERHGLTMVENKYEEIINLIKATLHGGEVKLKKDMPLFSKRSINLVSTQKTGSACGQLQDVATNVENVSSLCTADTKENQVPKDHVTAPLNLRNRKETEEQVESGRLPDFIPLDNDMFSPKCLATSNTLKKNGTTRSEANTKDTNTEKRLLPTWTSIWRSTAKKTDVLSNKEESVQQVGDVANGCNSAMREMNVVNEIRLTKDNIHRDGHLKSDNDADSRNVQNLSQTQDRSHKNDKEEIAADESNNQHSDSENDLTYSPKSEDPSYSFSLTPIQDLNDEIKCNPSNALTTVILEMQDKNASYKIRKTNNQWQFEDKVKNWKTVEATDADMLEKLFSNFADYSRKAVFQANI